MHEITIHPRFCGPPGTANGGYAAGRLAACAGGIVRVKLERPVPLGRALQVAEANGVLELRHGQERIATAEPDELDLAVPAAPSYLEAIEASRHFIALHDHPFPGCFVCGTGRAHGDGLRIFAGSFAPHVHATPGAIAAGLPGLVAAPWRPDASLDAGDGKVRAEFMWAALDCPGYFASRNDAVPMLLGAYTAHADRRVHIDESCVVVGWRIGGEGRKREVGTALYDEDGVLVAQARALWIEPRRPEAVK